MNKSLKIGAIVRFLNATGGGRVARITKDTAWIEDEDGFEIPTPINECVVVEDGDTFMPKYKPPTFINTKEVERRDTPSTQPKHKLRVEDFEDFDLSVEEGVQEPQRMPHTYLPAKGDFASCLVFVPQDIQRLGQSAYDWYLINDSDYTTYYVVSRREGDKWSLLHRGELYPEAEVCLGTIASNELNAYERLSVQMLAFAENPGIFKENVSAELRLDLSRFFKLHAFVENDFFEDKALVVPIVSSVERDSSTRDEWQTLSSRLKENIGQTQRAKPQLTTKPKSLDPREPIVVDLHIDELLDTTAGMDSADILSYQIGVFNKTMQTYMAESGRKLIFIHGKGDGILRKKLISELKYRYKHCHYQDASFQQYSYGATQITIGNKSNG